MKKKVTLLCAVAAMGVVAAAGVSLQNRAQLSDVALANIEALASGEVFVSSTCAQVDPTHFCVFPSVTGEDPEVWIQGVITYDGGDGAYTI